MDINELKQNFIEAKRVAESLSEPMATAVDALQVQIAELKQKWTQENAELVESVESAKLNFDAADAALREGLIVWHNYSGEKTFDEDLSVRVIPKLEYSADKATEWAKENAPFILVADKKQFENLDIVKTLDFVTVQENVSAVVSKKL